MEPIVVTASFDESEEQTFKHVPFTLPDGVEQLHLHVDYNDQIGSDPHLVGGNTLDIGVFDEHGIESAGAGLRGWSGSNKLDITIGRDWATPPYRAAEMGAGVWHLCLGAYKVGPNGLHVTATIELNPGIDQPAAPPIANLPELVRADVPEPLEPNWYRGDLHQHTVYSDGDSWPQEVAAIAFERGLDFYGITDHNRAQSPVDLVPHGDGWPVLVAGVEVTTYAGHFNVWGTTNWYDFRKPTAEGIQAAVDAARAEGGLVSLNHPRPFGPEWRYPEITGFDCTEPWNGWYGMMNDIAIGFWANQLNNATPDAYPVAVCGSDCHHNHRPGTPFVPISEATMGYPTLWVQTDEPLSQSAILDAIRAGRCYVSEGPAGPQVIVHAEDDRIDARVGGAAGNALVGIGPDGVVFAQPIASDDETISVVTRDVRARYIRFEVHAAGGRVRALTQPVWIA